MPISANIPVASSCPEKPPVLGQALKKPRRCAGAFSTTISMAPPHSPPTMKPWMKRSTTRRTGAQMPMVSYVGSRPTAKVAAPIPHNVVTSVVFRPMVSPRWPKTKPPSGRAMKPMPKVANEARVPANGLRLGKKRSPNTSALARP